MPKDPDFKPVTDEKLLYRIRQFEKDIATLLGAKPSGTLVHIMLDNNRELLLQSEAPDMATSYRRYYMSAASILRKIRTMYDSDRDFCLELCHILDIICDHNVMFSTKFLDQTSRYPATPIEELPADIRDLN